MNRRIPLVAGTAAGGLLTAAFLSAGVAAADTEGGGADIGDNAFTAGDFTFDPTGEADTDYDLDLPPLLQTGTGEQDFDVYTGSGDGTEQLGTLSADTDVFNVLGIDTTSFTFDADNFDASGDAGADGGGGSIDADAIADALNEAGISNDDFSGDQNVDSLANALADGGLTFDGNITGEDVVDALQGTEVADDFDIELDEGDSPEFSGDVDFTKGDVADALNALSGDGADGDAAGLPADGTSYTVTDFGSGIQNVYESVPADDGGSAEINDTLVTPFGNVDLSPVFGFFDEIFGDLFGDSGEESGVGAEASDIAGALAASDTDFGDGDLSNALADNLDFDGGDIGDSDIIGALDGTAVGDGLDIEDGSFSDADFQPGDLADALNDNLDATGGDVGAGDVEGALGASGTDFSDFDLSAALAGSDLDFGGDLTGGEVFDALKDTNVGDDVLDVTSNGGFDDVGFSPDDLADALNDNLDVGGGAGSADALGDLAGGLF